MRQRRLNQPRWSASALTTGEDPGAQQLSHVAVDRAGQGNRAHKDSFPTPFVDGLMCFGRRPSACGIDIVSQRPYSPPRGRRRGQGTVCASDGGRSVVDGGGGRPQRPSEEADRAGKPLEHSTEASIAGSRRHAWNAPFPRRRRCPSPDPRYSHDPKEQTVGSRHSIECTNSVVHPSTRVLCPTYC